MVKNAALFLVLFGHIVLLSFTALVLRSWDKAERIFERISSYNYIVAWDRATFSR